MREGSDYRTEKIDKNNMNSIAQLDNGSWKTIDVGVNGGANSRQPVNNKAMNRYMSSLDQDVDDAYALRKSNGEIRNIKIPVKSPAKHNRSLDPIDQKLLKNKNQRISSTFTKNNSNQ